MGKIVGCKNAIEISRTVKGANQHTAKLHTKSLGDPADLNPETIDMDAKEIAKAQATALATMLAMSDVTKAHYLALPDVDAQVAFMAKSADDQKAEAEAAKKAVDDLAEAEKAKAAGLSVKESELQKRLDSQQTELDVLKAAAAERELEKRCTTEFDGYPGGSAVLLPILKGAAQMPAEARKAVEDGLKTQAETAKMLAKALGQRGEINIGKTYGANEKIDAEVTKRVAADATKSMTKSQHYAALASEPEWAEVFGEARAELADT